MGSENDISFSDKCSYITYIHIYEILFFTHTVRVSTESTCPWFLFAFCGDCEVLSICFHLTCASFINARSAFVLEMTANLKLQDSRELLDNFREHCSKYGSSAFDFGEYNGVGRNNAINGTALAANHSVLGALLSAGFNKASLPTLRNALRLAQASLSEKGIEIQPADSEFEDFVSFVCKKCNVMLSHLRTIQRSTEKKEHCYQKMASDVEKRQVDNLLELLSRTVSTSPSPSPECEDDSQEVRKFPSLEELVYNSDGEISDISEPVEASEPAEAEARPPSNLKEVRQRQGRLSGARGGPKNQTKQLKKPAAKAAPKSAKKVEPAGKAAPKSAKAEKEEPACKFRVGKYSNKGYVQFLDTDKKWKLLVNVDYSNCSEDWKHTCHAVLDKLLEHAEQHQATKEELRNLRDELLGVKAVAESKTKKSKKPAASAAARASPVKKRPAAAPSAASASSDEAASEHPLLGSQDKLSPGRGMTVALSFSAFGSFK